jgi:predicted enzyme related to lactoylglutathione lyase
MDKSRKFYEDFLGFVLAMDMEWIMTFVSTDNPTAQLSVVKTAEPIPSAQDITITVEVSDVEQVHEKAKAFGINIIYPLSSENFGVRRFGVKDPSGVLINVMSHHQKMED